jgi:hypothetical protein
MSALPVSLPEDTGRSTICPSRRTALTDRLTAVSGLPHQTVQYFTIQEECSPHWVSDQPVGNARGQRTERGRGAARPADRTQGLSVIWLRYLCSSAGGGSCSVDRSTTDVDKQLPPGLTIPDTASTNRENLSRHRWMAAHRETRVPHRTPAFPSRRGIPRSVANPNRCRLGQAATQGCCQ